MCVSTHPHSCASLNVDGDNHCHYESQQAPNMHTVGAVAVTSFCLTAQNMPQIAVLSELIYPFAGPNPRYTACDNPQIVGS